jgi:DNA-binding transcriptional regulator YhcF (GntR family)
MEKNMTAKQAAAISRKVESLDMKPIYNQIENCAKKGLFTTRISFEENTPYYGFKEKIISTLRKKGYTIQRIQGSCMSNYWDSIDINW